MEDNGGEAITTANIPTLYIIPFLHNMKLLSWNGYKLTSRILINPVGIRPILGGRNRYFSIKTTGYKKHNMVLINAPCMKEHIEPLGAMSQ